MSFQITAVLFDLDGTIGNTLPLCIQAFRQAIEPLAGKKLTDGEIIATFGPTEEGTIAALLPDRQSEGLAGYLRKYEELHADWPRPFDGVVETMRFLKTRNVFVGLITGKGRQSAELTLVRYGLGDFFDVVKTGSASGPVKDKRIEEVIAEFSLDRKTILYVGDAPSDITASRDCRIKAAAAAWSPTADVETLKSLQPDYLFTSVVEFQAFLKGTLGE